VKLLALYYPPPTFYIKARPAWLRVHLTPYALSLSPPMGIQLILPGDQALAAAISRGNTTRLQQPPFRIPLGLSIPPPCIYGRDFL